MVAIAAQFDALAGIVSRLPVMNFSFSQIPAFLVSEEFRAILSQVLFSLFVNAAQAFASLILQVILGGF